MDSEQAPAQPETRFRFEDLPQVAVVEVDRYCEACGYNLHTQAVRRDPRTDVLLTRCPECGRYHAAADGATASRAWFRRLSSLALLLWVACVLAAAAGTVAAAFGIGFGTLDELTTWERLGAPTVSPIPIAAIPNIPGLTITSTTTAPGQTTTIYKVGRPRNLIVNPDFDDYELFMAAVSCASVGLAFVAALLLVVLCYHWKRRVYVVIAISGPILVAVLVTATWCYEAPHLLWWALGYITYHLALQALGGLAGVLFGRALTRGFVRAFIPPAWRSPLSYLWLIDGHEPLPATSDVAGPDGPYTRNAPPPANWRRAAESSPE